MRTQPDYEVRRKPRRWRRLGILFSAGSLALTGCSSLDSGSTASAPDPFLGPPVAAPTRTAVAGVGVQPPPGALATTGNGVLPAAAAPNSNVSVAALAPSSVRPQTDRDDLHIGSPKPFGGGSAWAAQGSTAVASTGGQAKLTPPDSSVTSPRTPPPGVLVQNPNPQASTVWPPPNPAAAATPNPAQPTPASATQPTETEPRPTTVAEAIKQLQQKRAQFQAATKNNDTQEWLFRCAVDSPKTNKVRTYEGRASDQLGAMLVVLDEINQGQ